MTKTFSFPVFYRQFYRRTSIFPSDPRRKKTPEFLRGANVIPPPFNTDDQDQTSSHFGDIV
jgi:hypothetical protein